LIFSAADTVLLKNWTIGGIDKHSSWKQPNFPRRFTMSWDGHIFVQAVTQEKSQESGNLGRDQSSLNKFQGKFFSPLTKTQFLRFAVDGNSEHGRK
jgi:hypothetical protein